MTKGDKVTVGEKYSACILAGGSGRRMGYVNKAFMSLCNEKFIDIVLSKFKDFDDVFIVAKDLEAYSRLKVRTVRDDAESAGALGAVLTGIRSAKYDGVVVMPCDMPMVPPDFLLQMAKLSVGRDGCVPVWNGYKEPLCAVYRRKCIKAVEKYIAAGGRKISSIFDFIDAAIADENTIGMFGDPEIIFLNVNTAEDLKIAERLYRNGL